MRVFRLDTLANKVGATTNANMKSHIPKLETRRENRHGLRPTKTQKQNSTNTWMLEPLHPSQAYWMYKST